MSVYNLIKGRTATNTVPDNAVQPIISGGGLSQPAQLQSITAQVSGTGAVTATVQTVVSNDGVNWSNFGTAISLSGTGSANGNVALQSSFTFFGAIVTAISGTGAAVNAQLSS